MTEFIVHVGLPKSGSTTLQRNFFHSHPELEPFSHLSPLTWNSDLASILTEVASGRQRHLARARLTTYASSRDLKTAPDTMGALIKRMAETAADSGKKPIYSAEGLTSARTIPWMRKLKHLQAAFDSPPRVIIVIRRPLDFLLSAFNHKIVHGTAKVSDFESWFWQLFPAGLTDRSDLQTILYTDMWQQYVTAFGTENVKVIPIEKLTAAPVEFYQELCDFMRVSPTHAREAANRRPRNQTTRKQSGRRFQKIDEIDKGVKMCVHHLVRDYYPELDKKLDLDLLKYNYYEPR